MKSYDNMSNRFGTHKVGVTLQHEEYKGFVSFLIGGNTKGLSVLSFDGEDLVDRRLLDNDCGLESAGTDEDWFSMVLKDDNGNTLHIEDELYELRDYVVKVEILEYTKEVD